MSDQARLVAALAAAAAPDGAATPAAMLETHISYVLLTGPYAYKIKKAVDFGFLDYTTLVARRFYCEEELRLNRRLAPALYLGVVPISGSIEAPVLGGDGPALEYAVKMRAFAQEALASRLLERGELGPSDIDRLAAMVAAFHRSIAVAAPDGAFGAPDEILRFALRNFEAIGPLVATDAERDLIRHLRGWTEREFAARRDDFLRRRAQGYVRECHGDLHLGNIARIDGELVIFDGIEFNEAMRWIDVLNEVAFTVMDLTDRGHANLAHRFLNAYLETTGDHAGLAVLPFYLVYRAMVRAKIARLRASQLAAGPTKDAAIAESCGYLALARRYTEPQRPVLIITHGLSGSGKTAMSQTLLEKTGAVRVRSDVERKRMRGLGALERFDADVAEGLYAAATTEATYARLRAKARDIVSAGRSAIVDATFLRHAQRASFRALAMELGVPFVILALEADEATLAKRIAARRAAGTDASDADLAVLSHQRATREPLAPDERVYAIPCDTAAEALA